MHKSLTELLLRGYYCTISRSWLKFYKRYQIVSIFSININDEDLRVPLFERALKTEYDGMLAVLSVPIDAKLC